MSRQTQEFFEELKTGRESGLAESLRESAAAARDIGGQIWDGMKPMFDHGRTELAAAIFSGHGHVMYMHGQNGIEQGQIDSPQPEAAPGVLAAPDLGREM
ncbi:hypothetical protein [Zavarzinella formosa]|uniref:hypothetical protein n=1 Tax=Zavarzinella formosa TaxID=360055 RepID=UPI000317ACB6|nr:hypothetical protein [Zavarzinella formosa]